MHALRDVPRSARRCSVQTACLVGVIAIGSLFVVPSAFADDPPTPTTFRAANAYSGTAGGVAWFRSTDDIGVAGYEITRDGRVLGTFDTLSYIDNDLEPGLDYQYGIRAVDTAGQRSSATFTSLRTPGVRDGVDGAPPPPANLRGAVYSSTAGGIAWTRAAVPGYRYSIQRRGGPTALGDETDGTSYVDRSLEPGIDYLYLVRTIAPDGRRSSAARVTLSTPGGRPPMLTNARLLRYSSTTAELFWDRPAASTRIRQTEVRRDGSVIGVTDGTSFVDSGRVRGESYRYELIAIDAASVRAQPAIIDEGGDATPPGGNETPPDGGETPAVPTELAVQLETLFDIANGKALETSVAVPARFRESPDVSLVRAYDALGDETDERDRRIEEFRCGNGGTAESSTYAISGVGQFTDYEFVDCAFGAVTVTGSYTDIGEIDRVAGIVPPSYAGSDTGGEYEINDFQLADARDGRVMSLAGFSNRSNHLIEVPSYTAAWGASRLSVASANAEYEVDDLEVSEGYTNDTRNPDIFNVDRRVTFNARLDGEAVTVTTTRDFHRGEDGVGNDYVGILSIVGPDYSYTLDAANGDPDSFQLNVATAGAAVSYTIPWSDELALNAFSIREVDFGIDE